jgi:CTP synthase (UTP-ammonia lyase)
MIESMRIGVIGDYNGVNPSHVATNAALEHAAAALGVEVEVEWLETETLTGEERLWEFDGLWAAPGSPYRSKENAFAAIRFAREQNWPFVGT